MSIFEPSTSEAESPVIGQEEAMPEEQQNLEGADNQQDADPEPEQDAETESSPDEGQEEEELIPASTHKELRTAFTRKAQEAAELKRQLEAMQSQQQQPPVQGQGMKREPQNMAEFEQSLAQQVAQMREEGYHEAFIEARVDAATANFRTTLISRQLEAQDNGRKNAQVNADIATITADYPDIATDIGMQLLASKVSEIAQEIGNPAMEQYPTKRILQMAAQEIWGDNKAKLYQSAKAKGKQEALDNIKAKQGVNTTISKKQNDQPKSPEDIIRENIVNAGRSGGIFG